jgi:uncharacterized protein YkwD
MLMVIYLFTQNIYAQSKVTPLDSLTPEEKKLYQMIMKYRKGKKLPSIPFSKSMTKVAKAHVKDLNENHPDKDGCNMHSWSTSPLWKGCCYTPDHAKAECMWNKPSELTNYKGFGFEISSYYGDVMNAEIALESWKSSKGHNAVMINSGIWKQPWKAIGIAIDGNYSSVWFGNEEDVEK